MKGDAQPFDADAEPPLPPTRFRAGDEPITGYRLLEPLGQGGFGEVWKCQAPGGFHKAIKFVSGASSVDQGEQWLAEQERQAIEFIKNIRHPFVLTVDRAELQHGTLMIVMELADRNLNDLLIEYAGRGQQGIPREELLNYLAEAAEALDLMNFEHGLQHLDVKPQNLFLIGSHVKVADFGLVNRLPEKQPSDPDLPKTASGVRGITPRYVSPEILQHRISRRSDQYSLAIVYQELLTGETPFKGRSARQLYVQHLKALPDLSALPESDRPAVARALAKDPEDRFASCRDFIRALRHGEASDAAGGTAGGERRTDRSAPRSGEVSLDEFRYVNRLATTPLGEIWQVEASNGETRWAYHLQGFAVETAADQEKALTYLQDFRHKALLRFKIAELTPHRVILVFEPWGPSLGDRGRAGQLGDDDLFHALAEVAHAVDELTGRTNLEHLNLGPETVVQGIDGEQLRDFGLISLLWKSGAGPLDGLNPRYAAPELAQGKVSPTSDQYSLAAMYVDLRTLQLSGKVWPAARAAGRGKPAVLDLDHIPASERLVLQEALDVEPQQRFPTCVALIEALAEARGGTASQATSAVQSALHATQASFLDTISDWIAHHEEASGGPPPTAVPGGGVEHVGLADIVPGTAKLRLDVFWQEWRAHCLAASDQEFLFFVPLGRSLWQRLRGQEVGVQVQVRLQGIDAANASRCQATLTIRPHNCSPDLTRRVLETTGPAILDSLRKCLNVHSERRRQKRWPCSAHVIIRHRAPGGRRPHEYLAEAFNISRTGIGCITGKAIEPGVEVRMVLSLPQGDEPPAPVLLKAVVRRCKPLVNGLFEVGAEFLDDPANPD
jgi:serine/threonine protein kinase